jgi:nitrate/TMAO reductase-like tetraheme cytochrome c subunit
VNDEKWWRRKYKWIPAWLGVPGALVLAFLAVVAGSVRYSESPSFCRSCHIMEPYYKAWQGSAHKDVACVECHYPPGSPQTLIWKKFQAMSQVAKYVTRTYSSKPFAEVDDASCMREGCHSTRLLEGKILTKTNIHFNHREHLTKTKRGRQLRCTSCHSQVVQGRHIEVTYETCFLCHFKGRGEGRDLKPLGGCTGCHDVPNRTIALGGMKFNHRDFIKQKKLDCTSCHVDLIHGRGDVPQDRCFTCHNQPEKIAKYNDTAFMHENHVTNHNVACFHCHDTIRHGFAAGAGAPLAKPGEPSREVENELERMQSPHDRQTLAFDCSYCHTKMHTGQLEMFRGKTKDLGVDLPEMPSPMHTAKVDCVGCHFQEKAGGDELKGKTFKASQEACVKCHGPKFKGVWEETKSELSATLAKLDAKRDAVAKALDGSKDEALQKKVADAAKLIRFVREARGEHNVYLASLALRKADAALSDVGQAVKLADQDLSALPLISGSYCATLCHEKVGVKVPPETVKINGKTMPHKQHTELMGCVSCHEISKHKSVPLKKDYKGKCAECHPEGP